MDESKSFTSKAMLNPEPYKKFSMAGSSTMHVGFDPSVIVHIDLESLHSYTDHAYKVIADKGLSALTVSIKENGVLSSLLVRRYEDGFQIISGHRRYAAALELGLKTVPCQVIECDDEQAALINGSIFSGIAILSAPRCLSCTERYRIRMRSDPG